jgi:hypothetical protein
MTDLASRVEARIRAEWPGVHITPLRGLVEAPEIREGGSTDALVKLAAHIIRTETHQPFHGEVKFEYSGEGYEWRFYCEACGTWLLFDGEPSPTVTDDARDQVQEHEAELHD